MTTSNATIGIPLTNARSVDGTLLSVTNPNGVGNTGVRAVKSGTFQFMPTTVGGFALASECPKGGGDNVVDTAILPVVIPSNYIAGSTALAVKLSTAVVVSGQGKQFVLDASSLSISVNRLNTDGSVTSIPVTTAAQSLPASGTDPNNPSYSVSTFNINGTSVSPGDVLMVSVQLSLLVSERIKTYALICSAQLVAAVQNYQTV